MHAMTHNVYAGEDELFDVIEEVIWIKSAFFGLGRALRLSIDELKEIRKTYSESDSDAELALNDVLVLWLRGKYNVQKFGPPTWRMLVKAVDSTSGGNDHNLAKKIASSHPTGEFVDHTKCSNLQMASCTYIYRSNMHVNMQ